MSSQKSAALLRKAILLNRPYTWVANPDFSANDYDVPVDVVCCELRTSDQSGTIYLDTKGADGGGRTNEKINPTTYDMFHLRVSKLRTTGSTSAVASGTVTLFGFYQHELEGRE